MLTGYVGGPCAAPQRAMHPTKLYHKSKNQQISLCKATFCSTLFLLHSFACQKYGRALRLGSLFVCPKAKAENKEKSQGGGEVAHESSDRLFAPLVTTHFTALLTPYILTVCTHTYTGLLASAAPKYEGGPESKASNLPASTLCSAPPRTTITTLLPKGSHAQPATMSSGTSSGCCMSVS